MRVRLKGINSITKKLADGTRRTYWYAWKGGPPLRGEPGSPEFVHSYNEAIAHKVVPPQGALLSILQGYQVSGEFLGRAERTRSDYIKQIKIIEREFGDFPLSALTDRRTRGIFMAWRDRLALKSRRQADYAWQVLALILAWGVDRGLILANPCARGGRLYRANRVDKIWTLDDQAAFLRSAPPHLHLPSAQQSRSHSSPLHGGWVLGQLKISHGITSSSREVGVSVRSSHREILATKHGDAPVTQRRRAHRRQRRGMSSRNGH